MPFPTLLIQSSVPIFFLPSFYLPFLPYILGCSISWLLLLIVLSCTVLVFPLRLKGTPLSRSFQYPSFPTVFLLLFFAKDCFLVNPADLKNMIFYSHALANCLFLSMYYLAFLSIWSVSFWIISLFLIVDFLYSCQE